MSSCWPQKMQNRSSFGEFATPRKAQFYEVPTLWTALIQLLLEIGVVTIIFLRSKSHEIIDDIRLRTVLQTFSFLLIGLIFVNNYFFHTKAKKLGYLSFYRKTLTLICIPVVCQAIGTNAVFVALNTWPSDFEHKLPSRLIFDIVVIAEALVIVPTTLLYIIQVWRHNSGREVPDTQLEIAQMYNETIHDSEFGTADYKGLLIEKQQELILYLQDQRQSMSEQVLNLTEKMSSEPLFEKLSFMQQQVATLLRERDMLKDQLDSLTEEAELSRYQKMQLEQENKQLHKALGKIGVVPPVSTDPSHSNNKPINL